MERRLYDIGSILSTLNLIRRTYVEGKRQPAFSWNWQWAVAGDSLAGGSPDGGPVNPPSGPEVWPVAGAGVESPRGMVLPLFAASPSDGSHRNGAAGVHLGHTLPQLTFPGLGLPPGGGGQMCLPTFPAVRPLVCCSNVEAAGRKNVV